MIRQKQVKVLPYLSTWQLSGWKAKEEKDKYYAYKTFKYIDAANEKMLIKVHAILEMGQKTDWWDDLSEEAKALINEGLKDMKAGRLTPIAAGRISHNAKALKILQGFGQRKKQVRYNVLLKKAVVKSFQLTGNKVWPMGRIA